MKELKTKLVLEYINKWQNWKVHVNKLIKEESPIQILQYVPWGRWFTGRWAKRCLKTITRPHGLTEVWKMTIMMIKLSIVYLPIISGLLQWNEDQMASLHNLPWTNTAMLSSTSPRWSVRISAASTNWHLPFNLDTKSWHNSRNLFPLEVYTKR